MNNFAFGDIVIVENDYIGVVVKGWYGNKTEPPTYEVYVRSFNKIKTYYSNEIRRYMIMPKELTEEDLFYQKCCEAETREDWRNAQNEYLFKKYESED